MEWYLKVLRQYADFEGRARRTEYWMFVLFNVAFSFLISVIAAVIVVMTNRLAPSVFLFLLYIFAMLLPSLAVTVRRLHDTGRSAWFLLFSFLPIIGSVCLFVFLVSKGTPVRNRYGGDPAAKGRTVFDRHKSVAVSLTVSSFVWIFSQMSAGVMRDFHFPDFLYCLIPSGLAAVGFLLMHEKRFTRNTAYMLIVTSVIWLIIGFYTFSLGYSDFFGIINHIRNLIIPAALMLYGLSVLEKKPRVNVAALMLIVSFCLWFIAAVRNTVHYGLIDDAANYAMLVYNAMHIMIQVSFLHLAVFLLTTAASSSLTTASSPTTASSSPTTANAARTPSTSRPPVNPHPAASAAGIKNREPDYYGAAAAGQNRAKNTVQSAGTNVRHERDNRGMRVETFSQSMAYWMVERVKSPRKDPFVYYVFKNEKDAHAALLALPFIHMAADSGKLICDELFHYGYFAVTNNGQFTGEYNAFISGADFTYDMWKQTHNAFSRCNGVKKSDLKPESNTASPTAVTAVAATPAATATPATAPMATTPATTAAATTATAKKMAATAMTAAATPVATATAAPMAAATATAAATAAATTAATTATTAAATAAARTAATAATTAAATTATTAAKTAATATAAAATTAAATTAAATTAAKTAAAATTAATTSAKTAAAATTATATTAATTSAKTAAAATTAAATTAAKTTAAATAAATAATATTSATTAAAAARSRPDAGNARKATFVREDREANSIWVIYSAPSKADAMVFLSQQQIVRPLYYVIVETPEGNFGRDKDGFYQE